MRDLQEKWRAQINQNLGRTRPFDETGAIVNGDCSRAFFRDIPG
jgi:hypothetical protein